MPDGSWVAKFPGNFRHRQNHFIDLSIRKWQLTKTFGQEAAIQVKLGQTLGEDRVEVEISYPQYKSMFDDVARAYKRVYLGWIGD